MPHLAMLLLSVVAFGCLALAMERHQEDVFGRPLAPAFTLALRAGGWILLACSLAIAARHAQGSMAIVAWFGYLTVGAGAVFLGLVALCRRRQSRSGQGITDA